MRGRQGIASHGIARPSRVGTRRAEHPEERRRGDCGGSVHAHRASAPQDDFLRGERTGPNWRLEEFSLRREPGEIFVDRNPRIRRWPQPPGRSLANRRRARDSARWPCRTIGQRPPGDTTSSDRQRPRSLAQSPGRPTPGVRDALAPRRRSRRRGRVREAVRRRRRPHDRGGRVSSRERPPRSAWSPAHDRHRVGSTGTHARRTSRPPANEWTRAPRGRSPPETRPSGLSRPTGQDLLDARDRAPSVRSGRRRDGRGWPPRRQERISLRRVQVPARGIGAQRPRRLAGTASTRSARGRSGRTARSSRSKAEPAPRCPAT